MIEVKHAKSEDEINAAFYVREQVYIREQKIDREDEFDEHDHTSYHFLATKDDMPVGASRYRITQEGLKFERFAVLASHRKEGIASQIMKTMLAHIAMNPKAAKKKVYLNAQLTALPLYRKFGFVPSGPRFLECEIEHQKMVLVN